MSLYKVQLQDYGSDLFSIPVSCGGRSLLLDFAWDSIAQKHYDDIQASLRTLATENDLVLTDDTSKIEDNADFIGYMKQLFSLRDGFESFSANWVIQLLQSPGSLNWELFETQLNTLTTSFNEQYISFNHISKMKNFQAYLQALMPLVQAENAAGTLSALQNAPDDLFDYASSYAEYILEVETQLGELAELLFWAVTVHHGENTDTTALEIGAIHFDQDTAYRLFFESPKPRIMKDDLGFVTLWVGFLDGSN